MSKPTTLAEADPPASASVGAGLTATGITKSYRRWIWPRRREVPVLRGADPTVGAGEVVGLVGENGSGTSAFMKILVGALAADAGLRPVAQNPGRRTLRWHPCQAQLAIALLGRPGGPPLDEPYAGLTGLRLA